MGKLIIGILLLFFAGLVFAGPEDELVMKANQDYSSGLYANAISGYLQVLEKGYGSAEVYYNLGNAYFKSNELASALLYYEKARKLSPNDQDILFNINVANSRIKDKIEPVPVLFFKRWWQQGTSLLSPDAWTRVHMMCFIGFLAGIVLYFLSRVIALRKIAFLSAIVLIMFSLLTFGIALQQKHYYVKGSEAIVFDPSLTVKSSPSENSVDLFVIHEGTKVAVTDKLGEWCEIRIANGSKGWILQSSVKTI